MIIYYQCFASNPTKPTHQSLHNKQIATLDENITDDFTACKSWSRDIEIKKGSSLNTQSYQDILQNHFRKTSSG
jgi:hypothetical protein